MKKLIILIVLSLSFIAWAGKPSLDITFKNTTDKMVMVFMYSLDHDVKINGYPYPYPAIVCGGEIQPGKNFVLNTRPHNLPPYRYLVRWNVYDEYRYNKKTIKIMIKIPPKYTNVIITPENIELW